MFTACCDQGHVCVCWMLCAGHNLQLAEDVFKLQHLLECNILQHREELEEITNAAVKEQQIETKLNGIKSDWQALNLVRALLRCLALGGRAYTRPSSGSITQMAGPDHVVCRSLLNTRHAALSSSSPVTQLS